MQMGESKLFSSSFIAIQLILIWITTVFFLLDGILSTQLAPGTQHRKARIFLFVNIGSGERVRVTTAEN